jgi:hypothetical protein
MFDATRMPMPIVRPNLSGLIGKILAARINSVCSLSLIGSKVREYCLFSPRHRGEWGYSLNQRLRSLIQQLGEAIHESVSESEQISGVVQDIRKQGFDVLLMLEATIGLNEVEQTPTSGIAALKKENADKNDHFSAQDVSFLRSLRISVEGDEDPGTE